MDRILFARNAALASALLLCFGWSPAPAQAPQASTAPGGSKAEVVDRKVKAINYRYRSGSTKIDFRGTELMPAAYGEAKVESRRGYMEIDVELRELDPARSFGSEYFAYVLWAITPEGRAQNLGEVVLRGSKSDLNVTTELQAFGMVVTAEPYFAVTQPSDVVVMENAVRQDTRGRVEEIEANYALVKRGIYKANEKPDELSARLMVVDPKVPLELYQARNAVRIARWADAEKYAGDTFNKAVNLLLEAEKYQARRRPETRLAAMAARQAVQTAEDARLISVQRLDEERLAAERQAAAATQAELRSQAARSAAEAERIRQEAERAAAEAVRLRQEAEQARQAAAQELARLQQEAEAAEAARAAAQADIERIREQAAQEVAALNAARATAIQQQELAMAEAQSARQAAEKAEREKAELRKRLQEQLNKVLETTNTARGLIVNMSDVLFDTGKYTLRPMTREKLAKISGLLLSQTGLKLEVEGHTDSVGSDEYNQRLSEQRAQSVLDFLVEQGISPDSIVARGFGETQPKADNETAAGRQQNRRVDLVVSGDAIGTSAEL